MTDKRTDREIRHKTQSCRNAIINQILNGLLLLYIHSMLPSDIVKMVKNDSFRVFGKVQELFGARFGIEQIKKKIIKHGKFTLEIMKIVIFSLFMVINGFFLRILFFFCLLISFWGDM
jgi:hypothetical protein